MINLKFAKSIKIVIWLQLAIVCKKCASKLDMDQAERKNNHFEWKRFCE